MAIVSDVEIRLRADIARLQQDMNAVRRVVSDANSHVEKAAKAMRAALSGIGAGISVAAFGAFIKSAIDTTDALNDLSVRTKISIEDLSGLAYAAKISDSSLEGIAGSISKLATNIGKDTDKFRRLGITAQDPIEAFKQLADIFKSIQDPQTRAAFGAEALGKQWQESAVLLNEGAAGIDALIGKGKELGGVTAEQAEAAGAFNDKLDDLGFFAQGVGRKIAAELLPTLNAIVDSFVKLTSNGESVSKTAAGIGVAFRGLYTAGVALVEVFNTVGSAIGAIAAAQLAFLQGDFKTAVGVVREYADDMGSSWAASARAISDAWNTTGKAVSDARAEAEDPFPDPFGIDEKFAQEAAARAVAFLKDSENSAAAKKQADAAAATAKKQADAYRDLTSALNIKVVETYREANGLSELTDGQKLQLEIEQKIIDGKLTLNAAQREGVEALIKNIDANKAAVESQKDYKKMQDDIEKSTLAEAKARQATIDAAEKEADANVELVATYGLTKKAVAELEVARLEAELAQRSELALTWDEIDTLEKLIVQKKRSAAAIANVEDLEQQRSLWTSIEKTAHDTFVSIADGGKGTAQRLKDTFKNVFFDWLYQQTLKKWVFNVGVGTSGSGLAGLASAATGSAGGDATSIFGGASNLISIGKAIYSGFTGGFATSLGSVITSLGETFGSAAVSSFGSGLYGGAGSALSGAAGAGASAAGAIPVVGWIIAGMNAANSLYKQGWDFNNGSVNAIGKVLGSGINLVDKLARSLGLSNTAANIISGLAPVSKLFGRKNPEITSQGIEGTFGAGGFYGQNFADILEKGGIFRSDKRYTQTAALSADQDKAFDDTIVAMIASVKGFGAALGIETSAIDGYNKIIRLALTNDEEKNKALITELFAGIGDELSTLLIPNIAKFSAEGETASATLQRLATNFQAVTLVFDALGGDASKSFGAVGVASIEARERLLALTGGLESLASQTDFFNQNFRTEAERMAPVQKRVNEQLAALGYAGITSADQFKAAVLNLASSGKLATEEGAKTYAGLLALAPEFKQLVDYLGQLETAAADAAQAAKEAADALEASIVQGLRDAAGEMFATLQRSVDADKAKLKATFDALMSSLGDSITAQRAKVSKLQGLSSALASTRVAGTTAMDRTAAQAQIAAALALARSTGYLPDAETLKDALSAVQRDAADQFSSLFEYQRDAALTQNSIVDLADLTDTQLSTAERTLAVLQNQQLVAQVAYNNEVARLDNLVTVAQSQLNAINGVNTSVLSSVAAFGQFAASIQAALKNQTIAAQPSVTGRTKIEALYNSLLGRAADEAGLQFYLDRLNEGKSLADIESDIRKSTEYQQSHYSYTAPPTAATGAAATLATAVDNLSGRMAGMETAMNQTATNTGQFATQFNNVSGGGNALVTEQL